MLNRSFVCLSVSMLLVGLVSCRSAPQSASTQGIQLPSTDTMDKLISQHIRFDVQQYVRKSKGAHLDLCQGVLDSVQRSWVHIDPKDKPNADDYLYIGIAKFESPHAAKEAIRVDKWGYQYAYHQGSHDPDLGDEWIWTAGVPDAILVRRGSVIVEVGTYGAFQSELPRMRVLTRAVFQRLAQNVEETGASNQPDAGDGK